MAGVDDARPDRTTAERPGTPGALPAVGASRGETASVLRRLLGLGVDWVIVLLISSAFFGGGPWTTLLLFLVEQWLLVGTAGGTIGHRVAGLAVRRLRGGHPGPWRALLRAALLCLVIPAVVWDGRGRGLHDVAAGTAVVRW